MRSRRRPRRRRTRTAVLSTATCTALAATACAASGSAGAGAGDAASDASASRLSVATGTTSGIYYPVGGVMSEIINREIADTSASVEATGASVENLRLLDSGDADLAIAQGDVVYQAVHGEGEFAGEPIEAQTLMVLYPNVYHAVSLASVHNRLGLDCFSDIAGRRFSVGAPGSGNELATNLVFDALDLAPDSDISRQHLAYADTARALSDGELDAGSWVVGEGHGSLRELEASDPIHLIPLCDDERDQITRRYPFYRTHTILADTYTTVDHNVLTIALWNVVAVNPSMSEERGYELARAFYENTDAIGQVYDGGARYLTLGSLQNSPVPLHPGLTRYAEEQGFTVPDELRDPGPAADG
ncbi:TAXI family TRAP transporter solute-binding subunit [Phytoactinopolyspora limicola]|uniref:TAXI family TRAP transporter solute-binding subunit n=1 Tax=Phytoactinopolyspora limicola TaxID=2715536 RepID=UPI0014074B22|nr:TAXI family TRAP transporter solute-binding subunit [Phytoactinopolyspora limicola]